MSGIKTKEKTIDQIFEKMGINTEDSWILIIWNDEHNDMLHVVKSLIEICQLDPDNAYKVMLETHSNGKSVVKKDVKSILLKMKKGLNDRGLEATVEKE